jgi:predicted pyridoxine 5'-phosphate oxidase superfamily flavin-nucleotide-binding protein
MDQPYHPGELAVQRRMGQADIAARVGRIIRADIPPKAAAFLAEQPIIVVVAANDDAGRMWTSLIVGPPGFMHAENARAIAVDALPVPGDPLADALRSPRRIGMIVLQPQTRRRMRVNGAAEPTDRGLCIHADQVYSNCPKYISCRRVEEIRPGAEPPQVHRARALDSRQQRAIRAADTFFVGSADPEGNADASHRGGNPGFLQILSPTRLRWPDYRGNSMFMTLGNIAADARCGLLVPDWHTGAMLQVTGTAEISWDEECFAPGSQCSIDFTVSDVVEVTNVSPMRWGPAEHSPANPA